MVKVICQYSGIEFEAATKRSKNHPIIAARIDREYKRGDLNAFTAAMENVKRAGGYATIEEFMTRVDSEMNAIVSVKQTERNEKDYINSLIRELENTRATADREYEALERARQAAFNEWYVVGGDNDFDSPEYAKIKRIDEGAEERRDKIKDAAWKTYWIAYCAFHNQKAAATR